MVEIAPIELELRKLGLTEKEVKVYLAGLELGPCSVQKIAEMAQITRPTTYEIIKQLEKKGLFEEVKKTGKRYFLAQSPERILGILRVQKREIDEKEREFIRVIAALESKYSKEKEGAEVFKGREGLKALEEILSFSSTPEILVINPKNLPLSQQKREIIYQKIKKRLGKIEVKEINAKFEGSLIIFDKVIFFPLKKPQGILMEGY